MNNLIPSKNAFIVGDFNCRIDNGCSREKELTMNFQLLNPDKLAYSYIAQNGSSTIDLMKTCIIEGQPCETHKYNDTKTAYGDLFV